MSQDIDGRRHQITNTGDIVNHNTIAVDISGQASVGNVISIHQAPFAPPPKFNVVIQPGPEHIGDEQRAKLKALVDDIVKLEVIARRAPKPHSAIWSALNKKLKTTSYHLIKAADYDKAQKLLREWIGRLSSTKSAEKKDPDWRKRKYSFIFANIKKLEAGERLKQHLRERYSVGSVKDLDDTQLSALYHTVSDWKRAGTASRDEQSTPLPRRA